MRRRKETRKFKNLTFSEMTEVNDKSKRAEINVKDPKLKQTKKKLLHGQMNRKTTMHGRKITNPTQFLYSAV